MVTKLKKSINIITLGCAKNRVDSEHIARAVEHNFEVSFDREDFDSDAFYFDVVVINTCGFILDAKTESIDTILLATEAKKAGRIGKLYAMGCLSQRYGDELKGEIEEVDDFFGARDFSGLLEALSAEIGRVGRRLSTPSHTAYLKIAEGCNWGCGYCAIPLIRGKYGSVPVEELVAEAKWLAERGTQELIVIAQDTTYYGIDLYGQRRLAQLLEELCRIEGVEWIRLQYAYPASFPREVIELMAREPKICPYIDIPFQHISDNMLQAMRRGLGRDETLELVEYMRATVPGIAIRTTLMVGYPGESEEDFQELCDFVRNVRFERLGVFAFCAEEGTYAADTLGDTVPQEVKEERLEVLMAIQQRIAEEISASRVGTEIDVLIDSIEGDYLVGRSVWDSPEVDGEVLIALESLSEECQEDEYIGQIVRCTVNASDVHDLYCEIL